MTNWQIYTLNDVQLDELRTFLYNTICSFRNANNPHWMNELFEEVVKEQHKRIG